MGDWQSVFLLMGLKGRTLSEYEWGIFGSLREASLTLALSGLFCQASTSANWGSKWDAPSRSSQSSCFVSVLPLLTQDKWH